MHFLYLKCSIQEFERIQVAKEDEVLIPTEIISNYLHKYFGQENIFVSFVFTSSNGYKNYFQKVLITKLMRHKLGNFSCNLSNGINILRIGNKNALNLILIDEKDSLS